MNAIHPLQTRVERLWGEYINAQTLAKNTLNMEDGIVAGRAWAEFLKEYSAFPDSPKPLSRDVSPNDPYIDFINIAIKGRDNANKRTLIISAYNFGFIDDEQMDFLFNYYRLDQQTDLLVKHHGLEDA